MIHIGPMTRSREQRQERIAKTVAWLRARYGEELLAVALYGSMARGTDGPFSDIELFCVVRDPDLDEDFEWVYGPSKAEINVLGIEEARRQASEVEDDWALSQGRFIAAQAIDGDDRLIEELRQAAMTVSDEQVRSVVSSVIVGDLYELVGKLRNARHRNDRSGLTLTVVHFTEYMALLLGLQQRRPFVSGTGMLAEALNYPNPPDGYATLAGMVIDGRLEDTAAIMEAIETAWRGMIIWAFKLGVQLSVNGWPQEPA